MTCNVIAFDSKSDQGNHFNPSLSLLTLLLCAAGWATGIAGSTLAAARRVKKRISQQVGSDWSISQCSDWLILLQVGYKGHNCELTVDYEEGFTLKDGQTGSIVFHKNFPELVTSSDDGAR